MKNKDLFEKTISILVKAYQNDTLKHNDCTACAVGNICAGPALKMGIDASRWANLFVTTTDQDGDIYQFIAENGEYIGKNFFGSFGLIKLETREDIEWVDKCIQLVKETGYSISELSKIEYAFETANKGQSDDEWMFNGLMSVCDALMIIHEATPEETESAKLQFVRP